MLQAEAVILVRVIMVVTVVTPHLHSKAVTITVVIIPKEVATVGITLHRKVVTVVTTLHSVKKIQGTVQTRLASTVKVIVVAVVIGRVVAVTESR